MEDDSENMETFQTATFNKIAAAALDGVSGSLQTTPFASFQTDLSRILSIGTNPTVRPLQNKIPVPFLNLYHPLRSVTRSPVSVYSLGRSDIARRAFSYLKF